MSGKIEISSSSNTEHERNLMEKIEETREESKNLQDETLQSIFMGTDVNTNEKKLTLLGDFYNMESYAKEAFFNIKTKKIPLLDIVFEDPKEGIRVANLINFVRGEKD